MKRLFQQLKHATKAFTHKDFSKNPSAPHITEVQKRALLIGLINSEQLTAYTDSLTTGLSNDRVMFGLEEFWDIDDEESASETIERLLNRGHRAYFNAVLPFINISDEDERKSEISAIVMKELEEAATEAHLVAEEIDKRAELAMESQEAFNQVIADAIEKRVKELLAERPETNLSEEEIRQLIEERLRRSHQLEDEIKEKVREHAGEELTKLDLSEEEMETAIEQIAEENRGDILEAILEERVDTLAEYAANLIECIEERGDDSFAPFNDENLNKGILAWDLGRVVNVVRLCYDAEFIDETTAWDIITHAYETTTQEFKDWHELAISYLIGRGMWNSDSDGMLSGLYSIASKALEENESPWKTISFK